MRRVGRFLELGLLWYFLALSAFAGPPSTPAFEVSNLEDVSQADAYAQRWVADYRKHNPNLDAPVLLFHLGDQVPEQLRWITLHLERAKIPFQLQLVTEQEFSRRLDQAQEQAAELLTFKKLDQAQTATLGFWKRSRLFLRKIFGLPQGITWWVKLESTPTQRKLEASSAAFQTAQAGVALGLSLYLVRQSGVDLQIAAPVAALMGWVFSNSLLMRNIAEVMTQGKTLQEVKKGQYAVRPSRIFFYLANVIRNALLNGLIVGTAFGWDQVLAPDQLRTNAENVGLGLVAGTWMEQWINSKQAPTGVDGKPILAPGKWTPGQTVWANTVWATLYYGIIRNLHLLHYGQASQYAYYTLAAVGTAFTLYEERYWFGDRARAISKALGLLAPAGKPPCQTLLMVQRQSTAWGSHSQP